MRLYKIVRSTIEKQRIMKKLLLLLSLPLIIIACNKKEKEIKNNETETPDTIIPTTPNGTTTSTGPLTGKWLYVENYVSPGAIWHWEKVQNGAILEIKADSTYEMGVNNSPNTAYPFFYLFAKAHKGILSNKPVGDDSFRSFGYLTNTATKDTQFLFYHKLLNRNDTIDIALPCIEGCSYRFVKMKD